VSAVAPAAAAETVPVAKPAGSVRRLLRRPTATISLAVIAIFVLATAFAGLVAPHSPTEIDYTRLFGAPSWDHPFGTDELGRDIVARVLYGGRTSLIVASASTLIAMLLGVVWGFTAALRQGWSDEVLMRVADTVMAMPILLVALVLVAAFGASTASMVVILGILFAPATARIARSTLLAELRSDYYLAAVSVGAPGWRIVARELLPNTLPVLVARASLVLADVIFVEASLSFIGLGVQPPDTSWGTLLQQGYSNLYSSYAYPIFPGLAILATVLALNTLGDNLQKVLDPSRA
jgi:peptide/nickel transport system permease protein